MFKYGGDIPRLVNPYGWPLPGLTMMLTGADVLINPLLLVATAVSE